MLSKVLGWVTGKALGLAGINPTFLLGALAALLASHSAVLWYGYGWGEKVGENAVKAAQTKELREAIAGRDAALAKLGLTIAERNEANAKLREQAAETISKLEQANEQSERRIRYLMARPVNRCDGSVVIDEQWMHDVADILERRSTAAGSE